MGEAKRKQAVDEKDEAAAIEAADQWLREHSQKRGSFSIGRDDVRDLVRTIFASGRRLSRAAASAEEILPGEHGPAQAKIKMTELLTTLRDLYPQFDVTIFLGEKPEFAPAGTLPRFNYGSTADRRDMVATLKAFIEKNETKWEKLEKIKDEPPTSSSQ